MITTTGHSRNLTVRSNAMLYTVLCSGGPSSFGGSSPVNKNFRLARAQHSRPVNFKGVKQSTKPQAYLNGQQITASASTSSVEGTLSCAPFSKHSRRSIPSSLPSSFPGRLVLCFNAGEYSKKSTLLLGALFAGWYGFNTIFNIANKTVLKIAPLPFTFTNLQFAIGSLLAFTMWGLRFHERPKISQDTVIAILPLAAVHTLGNLLTNVSLGKVAVSFTHTIKAMEPFFSVLLSSLFLGENPSIPVVLSLVPIVGGVIAASASEATFNWGGFLAAMGSNITFQSRNVFSKKFMGSNKGSLDNINLFSLITILSFFLLAPFTLLREGFKLTNSGLSSLGIANSSFVFRQAIYAALCFHAYQQVSYMILERVSPVTHSIGNCLKRVIVIVASVIFFQNPVSKQNIIGTSIALAGVFVYSQVKRLAKPAAAKAA